MKKVLISLWVCGVVMLTWVVSSYFESRYRCNIGDWTITISMDAWEQKCFAYLAGIHQQITQVDTDLEQANNFITRWTDTEYRTWIVWTLRGRKSSLQSSQTQTLLAIEDFERSLFNQIKSLLQFYLKQERNWVISDVDSLRGKLLTAKTVGNQLLFEQYRKDMESLQYKLFLLDRIQFSHDFEELVPFLKEFLYGWSL